VSPPAPDADEPGEQSGAAGQEWLGATSAVWDEPGPHAGAGAAGDAQRRLARRMLAGIGLLLLAVLAVSALAAVLHRQEPGVEYRFVIPHGTAERVAAGEAVDILPARIEMRTQDTLVIENRDHEPFSVGGLRVAGEQTMTYRFSKPGSYGGSCQLHAGGTVDIVVT
jgi:hypothetical protein